MCLFVNCTLNTFSSSSLPPLFLPLYQNALESKATGYGRCIEPLLSLAIDFYVRVFVRVRDSKAGAKDSCLKRGYVLQSPQCSSFYLQPMAYRKGNENYSGSHAPVASVCEQTSNQLKLGGPFWTAPLHHPAWVGEIIRRVGSNESPFLSSTKPRIIGMLTAAQEELIDVPLYYSLPDLCAAIKVTT